MSSILRSILATAIVAVLALATGARAATITAVLESDAHGHEVEIRINGVRLSEVTGGSQQILRLYAEDDPRREDAPETSRDLFVLRGGENEIRVCIRRVEEGQDLELRLLAPGISSEPLFRLASANAAEGGVTRTVVIPTDGSEPSTIEVGDADLGPAPECPNQGG